MNKDRKSGYYFITIDGRKQPEPAWYDEELGEWHVIGDDAPYYDKELSYINENQIKRDESKD